MTRRASQSSCGSAVSLKQASLLRASRREVTRSNTAHGHDLIVARRSKTNENVRRVQFDTLHSLDHLVGAGEQRYWYFKPERFRSL